MFETTDDASAWVAGDEELIASADAMHVLAGRAHRELLRAIAEIDRRGAWRDAGARDAAHWVSMRYGISTWKAQRWVAAGHALGALPAVADALQRGELGVDKVVEITRFATPETEARLLRWARAVSSGAIRRRADLEARRERRDTIEVERDRYLRSWYEDEGRRFMMEAQLPADQGAIVAKAIERVADTLPGMPRGCGAGDAAEPPGPRHGPGADDQAVGGPDDAEARRADALVLLCSARIAADPDPDRATLVIHASLETLAGADRNAEIENGPAVSPDTARRLACDARLQVVAEDEHGQPLRLGRLSRDPSSAMLRQLRHRDRECRFPGCGMRRFTNAHHVTWWSRGGATDLENLVLICTFHHRLVHEHGWRLARHPDNAVDWFQPDGVRYRTGPAPPELATPA
jgi:hypothetical protein